MKFAPIVLFVYNRPIHTKKTVQALKVNKLASKSILYIYSDYPKKEEHIKDVKEVREYIHTIKGFKEIHIIERKQNYGLAKSIIEGLTEVML
jgi:GT2 family glycosyltransferase